MPIDENGVASPKRLKVGDETKILGQNLRAKPEVGKLYDNQLAFDPPGLSVNDGVGIQHCTVRVEEIEGDTCICVVTDVYREEI